MALGIGDDVAELLSPPHDGELRRWLELTGRTLQYAGWMSTGFSSARVIAVYANNATGTDARKLLLKYVSIDNEESSESIRYQTALDNSPTDFAERHLVSQPWDPISLSGGGWILFQNAGSELTSMRTMSEKIDQSIAADADLENLPEAAGAVISALLDQWNPVVRYEVRTAGEYLSSLLGHRLMPGHPLMERARVNGLLVESDFSPAAIEVGGLLNPLALLKGPHPARERRVFTAVGRVHGDLHPGNVLLGSKAGNFRLVDLARFSTDAPLTLDPVRLMVTTAAHLIRNGFISGNSALAALMLNPTGDNGDFVPSLFCRLIDEIHSAGNTWSARQGLSEEWREEVYLSFAANSFIMSGSSALSDNDREWFLQLSALAASKYVELGSYEFPSNVASNIPSTAVSPSRGESQVPDDAPSLDDLGKIIRTRFPYPIALRWRQIEADMSIGPSASSYQNILETAEVFLCYSANLALALTYQYGTPIKHVQNLRTQLAKGRGPSFGDWIAVLEELRTSRAYRMLPTGHPLANLRDLFASPDIRSARARLSKRRNDKAHLRSVDTTELPEVIDESLDDLLKLLRAADFLSHIPLVHVTSVRWDSFEDRATISYRELSGDHPIVLTKKIHHATSNLEENSLYLLDDQCGFHLLRPALIGRTCPVCKTFSTFHIDRAPQADRVTLKSLEHGHCVEDVTLGRPVTSFGLT